MTRCTKPLITIIIIVIISIIIWSSSCASDSAFTYLQNTQTRPITLREQLNWPATIDSVQGYAQTPLYSLQQIEPMKLYSLNIKGQSSANWVIKYSQITQVEMQTVGMCSSYPSRRRNLPDKSRGSYGQRRAPWSWKHFVCQKCKWGTYWSIFSARCHNPSSAASGNSRRSRLPANKNCHVWLTGICSFWTYMLELITTISKVTVAETRCFLFTSEDDTHGAAVVTMSQDSRGEWLCYGRGTAQRACK